jgi:hypothetical protein
MTEIETQEITNRAGGKGVCLKRQEKLLLPPQMNPAAGRFTCPRTESRTNPRPSVPGPRVHLKVAAHSPEEDRTSPQSA